MYNEYLEYLKLAKKYLSPDSEDIDTVFEIILCKDAIKDFEKALTEGGIGFISDDLQLEKINYNWIFINGCGHYHFIEDNNPINASIKIVINEG